MIQIIAGTFGYYNGRKVIPITEADGPQKLDPELEARLVKKGVAKFVDPDTVEDPESTDPAGAPAPQDPDNPDSAAAGDPETPDGEDPEDPADAAEYSEDMKLDELKEIAVSYGVDTSAMRKKADVIAAIEAAKKAAGADDEEPPQIGAADPV